MDPERLKTIAGDGVKTAAIQMFILSTASIAVSYMLSLSPFETLIFTLTVSLSSTLVGLDLIEQDLNLELAHGRIAESIHLSQDMIAVLFLMVVGASTFTPSAIAFYLDQPYLH